MFALDLLRVLLANGVLLWGYVPLVRSPSLRVKPRDPKRLQQGLQLQKDGILPHKQSILHLRSSPAASAQKSPSWSTRAGRASLQAQSLYHRRQR